MKLARRGAELYDEARGSGPTFLLIPGGNGDASGLQGHPTPAPRRRLIVEPVTEEIARAAAGLLADAGLHGHQQAIDAMLCATALASAPPAVVLTSDPDDLKTLGGQRITVVKL